MTIQTDYKIGNLAVLVNPRAGEGLALKVFESVLAELQRLGITFHAYSDEWPRDLSAFSEAWIIGGDGTVNHFVNRYRHALVPFAVFKGGKANDFHFSLHGNISRAREMEIASGGKTAAVDAGLCNDTLFVANASLGFGARVTKSQRHLSWLSEPCRVNFANYYQLLFYRSMRYRITTLGKTIDERKMLVIVTNGSRTGSIFDLAPKASVTDGKLDVILGQPIPVAKRFYGYYLIKKGMIPTLDYVDYFQPAEISIDTPHDCVFRIDGDVAMGRRFSFSVMPGFLQVKT